MTASESWPEGQRPEHDPVAEGMDLLTHREAAARFFDELERLRAEAAGLGATDGADQRLVALHRRMADLQAALERLAARRTPPY